MKMRDLINLVEDQSTQAQPAQIQGTLPAQDLAKMLPAVADVNSFMSAIQKVQNGNEADLMLNEIKQLANAFISLIQLPDIQKTAVIQKMMPVSMKQQQTS